MENQIHIYIVHILLILLLNFNVDAKQQKEIRDQVIDNSGSELVLDQSELKIKYIANEGFLISSKGKKIALDAFFEGYHSGDHVEPSLELINKMKNCQPPFDSIDLITISHVHLDHVSVNIVGKQLECNTKGIVVCDNMVGNMMKSCSHYEQIKDRIKIISIPWSSAQKDTISGIEYQVFRTQHAMEQFKSIINLGFVINVNGIKIYHSGDSFGEYIEELENFKLSNENIDIAFLEYEFLKTPDVVPDIRTGLEKIRNYINPKYIVLMHVEPYQNNNVAALCDSIVNEFQGVFFFKNSMDSISFNFTSVDNKMNMPLKINLEQNYPNPFNPSTTIKYQLKESCNVKLKIYNTLGQEIKTLVNAFQNTGEYSIEWDGNDESNNVISSGVYFYSLITNEKGIQKKMILLR